MIAPDRLLPQKQIYNFLRTVSIKFSPLADYVNATLIEQGYEVNEFDQRTWKYYINLQGRYHISDTKMYVTSLDTREEILLTPETMTAHPRTKAVYSPGGLYYNQLCEKYPEQVDLIKCILYPAGTIDDIILAPDLTLLAYGSGYLEEWEEPGLTDAIRTFLEIYKERWYFDFLDDELYFHLTVYGNLWVYLAMLLLSERVANIKTPYVHSWDLWAYLESKGLDNYSDVLDREKSMFLYQNIDYFRENAGKQSNLLLLSSRLLESFGIGLYGRRVVQETESGKDAYQLTPQLAPIQIPQAKNYAGSQISIKSVATVQDELFEKGLTDSVSAEKIFSIERELGDTTRNEFTTKLLEIKPIAQLKPYAEMLNVFLIETLMVSIKEGYYSKAVEIIDPLTKQPIYLPPSELMALFNYAVLKGMGIDNDVFPKEIYLSKSFTTSIKPPKQILPYDNSFLYTSQYVDTSNHLANLGYDRFIDTPEEFSTNVTTLWLRFVEHVVADQSTKLETKRYVLDHLDSLCHQKRIEPITLVKGYNNYTEWLGANGIDIQAPILDQYSIQLSPREHWNNLADTIIGALIPMNKILFMFGNFTLSNSGYNRLRQLFIQLCSYQVVFLEADRDTYSFSAGGKWSTDYGPIDSETLRDHVTKINVATSRVRSIDQDRYLHPGVIDHILQHSTRNILHTVNLTTTMTGDIMTRPREAVSYMGTTIAGRKVTRTVQMYRSELVHSTPTP